MENNNNYGNPNQGGQNFGNPMEQQYSGQQQNFNQGGNQFGMNPGMMDPNMMGGNGMQGNMGGGMSRQFRNEGDGDEDDEGYQFNNKRYKTALCNNWVQTQNCKFGDSCKFAHGEEDLRQEPQQVMGYGNSRGGSRGGFVGGRGGDRGSDRGGGRGGFNTGRGGRQAYNHNPMAQNTGVCNLFVKTGYCKFGDTCKFAHSNYS